MRQRSYELWFALLVIIIITAVYAWLVNVWQVSPASSGLFGHLLGIVGFILMLMTETLYSLRKRSHKAGWGRMAFWLRFHIFTGLVGPHLVLLHTAWQFKGLAGAVTLLTAVVVISGFIGRYIYTAVPRTADGAILAAAELEAQIAAAEARLQRYLDTIPRNQKLLPGELSSQPFARQGWLVVLGRPFQEWHYRRREQQRLKNIERDHAKKLQPLLHQRRVLRRQIASLAATRRLLSLWHAIHVPLGMALFVAAFIHIFAAVYYATLLR